MTRVIIEQRHPPGLAADLAVLHIILDVAAPRIESDLDALPAIWTDDERIHLGGTVTEGELLIELGLELGVVGTIGLEGAGEVVGEAHQLMIVRGQIICRTGRNEARW